MAYDEIENLSEEEINNLYNDVMEFDSDYLGLCCCANGATNNYGGSLSGINCHYWCRGQGTRCLSFGFNLDGPCNRACPRDGELTGRKVYG